jgi:hypothetical protein
MLYAIHNENGEIIQANKIWHATDADKKYEDGIRGLGQKFVKKKSEFVLHPDQWWVKGKKIKSRPSMFITVSSTIVRAGGVDAAVLRGCPMGATWALMIADLNGAPPVISGVVDDPDMEFPFDHPGRYCVIFDLWPFQTCKIDLEAMA